MYRYYYFVSAVGLAINSILLFKFQKKVFLSFFLDLILISALVWKSELSLSLFLFLYLIEILLMGLVKKTRGAMLLAAWGSVCFNIVLLLGPDIKAMTFFITLILYNIAFFAIAWISGMLAEQLELQGISLNYLQALNESIVQTIPSGLLIVKKNGEILSANPGAEALFKATNVEGRFLFDFLPQAKEILQKLGKEKLSTEVPLQRENDNLLLSMQYIFQSEKEQTYLIVLQDITEVKRLQLSLMHQQKLAAIGGLASGIAHELGNPLAAVSANIQFLEPKIKIEDETDKKLIQNTHREISRLGKLIAEFKDFAKPEKIPVSVLDLQQVLNQVLETVKNDPRYKEKLNIQFSVLSNATNAKIRGDYDKLLQVFLNAVVNALQAVEESAQPKIEITIAKAEQEVIVTIKDNGIGMSEETKTRLFEPFYTTKGRAGTGLGLAVSYKILQAHNAKVVVESEKGKGSTFYFRFPVNS